MPLSRVPQSPRGSGPAGGMRRARDIPAEEVLHACAAARFLTRGRAVDPPGIGTGTGKRGVNMTPATRGYESVTFESEANFLYPPDPMAIRVHCIYGGARAAPWLGVGTGPLSHLRIKEAECV
ncbi:hypothetical protein GCM10023081_07390 [Arthrobacter ginkgonis]|uniref:Uncharacterized protein n=1 Tax=Arthrobacter ginkgonis TaxID=1630594 RepID=A0ABP7BZF5_9MICC